MSKESGFTLIELVVVIVILGILAATALPKFVDLSSDAGDAAAQGVAGALASATSMNYAKYQINSSATGVVQIKNTTSCDSLKSLMSGGTWQSTEITVSGTLGASCTAGATDAATCVVKHSKGSTTGVTATVVCTG